LSKLAELIEEGLRNSLVVRELGLAYFVRLVSFSFSLGGDGEAGPGEGVRDIGRRGVEGNAGVANGVARDLDASSMSS
jgi:hypothetical protein